MNTLRRIVFGVVALLLAAGPAAGSTFTLSSTIQITGSETDNPGVVGEIRPVFNLTGTVLAVPQDGTINFASQDVFVIEIELFGGSALVDELSFTVVSSPLIGNPVGAGAFDDSGDQAPDAVQADGANARALFQFDKGNLSAANLTAGETSTRLFATYEASGGGMGALAEGNAVGFMVSSGAFNFNTASGTIVPEPTTALLLAAGLTGLGFAGRRRGTR